MCLLISSIYQKKNIQQLDLIVENTNIILNFYL